MKIRRGKLNSQFIVTDFSILHTGTIVQSTRNVNWFELAIAETTPFSYSTRGDGCKGIIVTVFNLKSEVLAKM